MEPLCVRRPSPSEHQRSINSRILWTSRPTICSRKQGMDSENKCFCSKDFRCPLPSPRKKPGKTGIGAPRNEIEALVDAIGLTAMILMLTSPPCSQSSSRRTWIWCRKLRKPRTCRDRPRSMRSSRGRANLIGEARHGLLGKTSGWWIVSTRFNRCLQGPAVPFRRRWCSARVLGRARARELAFSR